MNAAVGFGYHLSLHPLPIVSLGGGVKHIGTASAPVAYAEDDKPKHAIGKPICLAQVFDVSVRLRIRKLYKPAAFVAYHVLVARAPKRALVMDVTMGIADFTQKPSFDQDR